MLYFWGDANDGEEDPCFATDLWVTLGDDDDNDGDVDDSYTIYYVADCGGDDGDLIAEEWIEWNIALQDFNEFGNVNPDKIRSIGLGVKDGTTGNVYYDDIMLYVRRCVPMYAVDISSDPEGDYEGAPDCFVDGWDLALMFFTFSVSLLHIFCTGLSGLPVLRRGLRRALPAFSRVKVSGFGSREVVVGVRF